MYGQYSIGIYIDPLKALHDFKPNKYDLVILMYFYVYQYVPEIMFHLCGISSILVTVFYVCSMHSL